MDSEYSAQDVARCDLCKIAITQNYCDSCHVNLCKPCIVEHISADDGKHTIVPFQRRKSTLILAKCEIHQNKTCKYQCQDCDIFVCSDCAMSKQHKGHEYLKLEELFNTSKERIGKDKEDLDRILPTYEEIAIELENQIANLDEEYEKLTTEMSKQREEMHREVDKAINQMEEEICEIKLKHHNILKEHLNDIKQVQSLMQKTLVSLNEIEESNEVSPTIHYNSKVEEFRKLPPKVNISMPKFILTGKQGQCTK
ncbi:E3 ubiquitin ligase TRIM40-like [Crassostrea virginica]